MATPDLAAFFFGLSTRPGAVCHRIQIPSRNRVTPARPGAVFKEGRLRIGVRRPWTNRCESRDSAPPRRTRDAEAGRVGRTCFGTSIMPADKGGMSGISKRSRIVLARRRKEVEVGNPGPSPPCPPRPRWLMLRGWLQKHSMSAEVIRFGRRPAGPSAVEPEHAPDRTADGLRRSPSATDEVPPAVTSARRDARPGFDSSKRNPVDFSPFSPAASRRGGVRPN